MMYKVTLFISKCEEINEIEDIKIAMVVIVNRII